VRYEIVRADEVCRRRAAVYVVLLYVATAIFFYGFSYRNIQAYTQFSHCVWL